MVTPITHVIAGPDLHRAGPLALLPNIGEDQKKSYNLSAGPLAGTAPYCGKFDLVNALRS